MISLLSALLFMGTAIGLLTYWIIMMFKDSIPVPNYWPLLISGVTTAIVLLILDISYADVQKVVGFVGHLSTPAMVCLAIPLYQQIQLLKKNGRMIFVGVITGILGSAFSVILMAALFGATHEIYIHRLPQVFTSAIMSGLSGNTGIMIVVISIAVVAVELIGYIAISFISMLACKKSSSDKVEIDSMRNFATVVACIMIASTNAFLVELL